MGFFSATFGARHLGIGMWMCLCKAKCASRNVPYSRHRALHGACTWNGSGFDAWLLVSPNYTGSRYKGCPLYHAGCAITLVLTGADLSEIMDQVGWTHRYTALYYVQLVKVLNPSGTSARLASNVGSEVTSTCQDINQLKRFICAFPKDSTAKILFED